MEEMNGASHGEGDGASMPSPGAMILKSLVFCNQETFNSCPFVSGFFFKWRPHPIGRID